MNLITKPPAQSDVRVGPILLKKSQVEPQHKSGKWDRLQQSTIAGPAIPFGAIHIASATRNEALRILVLKSRQ